MGRSLVLARISEPGRLPSGDGAAAGLLRALGLLLDGRRLPRPLKTTDLRFEDRNALRLLFDVLGLLFDYFQQQKHERSLVFVADGRNHLPPCRRRRCGSVLAEGFVISIRPCGKIP